MQILVNSLNTLIVLEDSGQFNRAHYGKFQNSIVLSSDWK